MRFTHVLAAAAVSLGLAVTGCGDDESTEADTDVPRSNAADVEFIRGMMPHHQQAIEMAALARDQASDPAVRRLAVEIETAQAPEIDTMLSWLDEWGVNDEMAEEGHGDMDHDMTGMLTNQQIADLQSTSGPDFDRTFLTLMIEHHEGAIEMAQTEQREGNNADAIALAERIEATQTREIDQMEAMLGR